MRNYASLLKIIFCIGMLVLLGFKGQAQQKQPGQVRNLNGGPIVDYYNAVGLRLGNYFAVTGKHFMRDGNAVELMIGSHLNRKGITGTFIYEFHRNAFEAKRLLWYYGGGGHVGYFKYNEYYEPSNNRYNRSGSFVTVGADGIIGIEYSLGVVPLAISADVKPYLNLIGGEAAGVDGAITVKYVF